MFYFPFILFILIIYLFLSLSSFFAPKLEKLPRGENRALYTPLYIQLIILKNSSFLDLEMLKMVFFQWKPGNVGVNWRVIDDFGNPANNLRRDPDQLKPQTF